MRFQLPVFWCLLVLGIGSLGAQTTQPVSNADFAQRFTGYLDQHLRLPESQRRKIIETWQADMQNPQRKQEASSRAMTAVDADFARALTHLANEEHILAQGLLEKSAQSSDAMLAVHARFYLARMFLMQNQGEQARVMLEKILDPQALRTPLDAEATYMLGVSQAQLLDRTAALQSLKQFLDRYPDAPERLCAGAKQMIEQLNALSDGSLRDVQDRMGYSHRRLELARTDQPTQTQQNTIVALLDKLIEQAKQQEQQNSGSSGSGSNSSSSSGSSAGRSQNRSRPANPANQSTAPVGSSNVGQQHGIRTGRPEDQWGQLPERQRQEVLNALKARFPDRYRELVEQYYKSLQEQPQP